jgi:two-component system, NarL family, response regulator
MSPLNQEWRSIRALVADDHPMMREGLKAFLNGRKDMRVVGEAANGREAITQFFAKKPDVAIIDLRMPDMDGVEVIATIRQRLRSARIIIYSAYDLDEDIYRSLRAGALGFLLKSDSREHLIDCIFSVIDGNAWLPPRVSSALAQRVAGPTLTTREKEVLRLVAEGKTNKEIGAGLGVTEGTAKSHLSHLIHKLGADNRSGAVAVAVKRGIVRLSTGD